MKKTQLLKIAIFALIAILIIIGFQYSGFLSLENFQSYRSGFEDYVQMNYLKAIALFMAIYIVVTAISLPGAAVLTLIGGALFGLIAGVIAVSFASTIGATLSFLLSRYLLRDFFREKFHDFFKKVDDGIRTQGGSYLFSMRLLPIFPFFVVNALMGLTNFSVLKFFIISQIGMLPGTIVYVWAGSELGELTSVKGLISPSLLAAFAALAFFPYVVKFILRKLQLRKLYKNFERPKKFDYNLIVIGAGAAGLVSTAIARAVKAKVLLIESHKMGGDCLNFGCVPSKALIHATQKLAYTDPQKNFEAAREHVRSSIQAIEPHDSVERFQSLGADVVKGAAEVVSPWQVRVNQKNYTSRHLIIASGASPIIPKIPGIEHIKPLTSDTIWDLNVLPQKLLIVGGGPIGCELSQAFAKLGVQVTLIERGDRILAGECTEASNVVYRALEKSGVHIRAGISLEKFESSQVCIALDSQKQLHQIEIESVLFAIGRKPRVEGFGLEKLGLEVSPNGTLAHNELMQTKFPNISVCGDVAGPIQLTHVAGHQAWYAAVNSLFSDFKVFNEDLSVIPRCTFTSPEVASVGLTERQLQNGSVDFDITHYEMTSFDRAVCDDARDGFVRILTRKNSDQILGATIVAPRAGEMIMEFTLAMRWKLGLKKILSTVHPYPTWSDANKLAALAWQKKNVPHQLLKWVEKYHDWKRS